MSSDARAGLSLPAEMPRRAWRGRFQIYARDHRSVFLVGLMVFFWTFFDASNQYVTPLLIDAQGFSSLAMGAIIASSSIVGAIFDFFICRLLRNTSWRRVFLVMFALCLVYPALLWSTGGLWLFLLAMAWWGVYFDLFGFGTLDFVGREMPASAHSSSYGIIQMFRALGVLVAPLIVGSMVAARAGLDRRIMWLAWAVLLLGAVALGLLLQRHRRQPLPGKDVACRTLSWRQELKAWRRVSRKLWPVLLFSLTYFITDAYFWTLAPLFAEKSTELREYGGLFLTVYALPALFCGWIVGPINRRWGKKRTAFVCLLFAGLVFMTFRWWQGAALILVLTMLGSFFIDLGLPSINGAFADYVSEAEAAEGEISALNDLMMNLGYIVGPLFAGAAADFFDLKVSFSILGVFILLAAVVLLAFAPKKIEIRDEDAITP